MDDKLTTRHLVQLGALFLISDGIIGLLRPRWHSLLWLCAPQLLKAMIEELSAHPKTARAVYLSEAAIGLALASSATAEDES